MRNYDIHETHLVYVSRDDYVGVVNLETEEEIGIPILNPGDEAFPTHEAVALFGSTVVYSTFFKREPSGGRLWRYDLETRCLRMLREFASSDDTYVDVPVYLDVEGGTVGWIDERYGAGRQDVFVYDLPDGTERRLTFGKCCVGELRLWGSTGVYQGWSDGPHAIHAVDVGGGGTERLWEDPREQAQPAIHGDTVVFMYEERRRDPRNTDIHGVNLKTGDAFTVASEGSLQTRPDVHGSLVVWEDHRNDEAPNGERQPRNVDIYARDLAEGTEFQVTSLPGLELRPRLWQRTVFFRSRITDGPLQIYASHL